MTTEPLDLKASPDGLEVILLGLDNTETRIHADRKQIRIGPHTLSWAQVKDVQVVGDTPYIVHKQRGDALIWDVSFAADPVLMLDLGRRGKLHFNAGMHPEADVQVLASQLRHFARAFEIDPTDEVEVFSEGAEQAVEAHKE